MNTTTPLLLTLALFASCARHERLSVQPCDPLELVERRSEGFEADDVGLVHLDEARSNRYVWEQIDWVDGQRVLFSLKNLSAIVRSYRGRLTDLAADATASLPIQALPDHVRPIFDALGQAGFAVERGDLVRFASTDPTHKLRSIEFRKGDYLVELVLEISDSGHFFRLVYGATSAGACRSAAYIEWIEAEEAQHTYDRFYDY